MLIFVLIILFLFTLSVFKLFILAIKMIKPFLFGGRYSPIFGMGERKFVLICYNSSSIM